MALTISDVQNVRTEGMGAAIAATAHNVAAAYLGTTPDSAERLIAEDILDAWIGDAAQEVRVALSQKLRDCRHLPRKLAMRIAVDVEPVAVPILLSSEVFSDEDLCVLASDGSARHQIALARREFVPHALSETLVETEREEVVTTLVNNKGAKLSEPALHRVIDCFPGHQTIHTGLVERAVLPVSVGDRLLSVVVEALQSRLIERFELPGRLAGPGGDGADTTLDFIDYLHRVQRLTPIVLLRALCDGRIDVFEAGLMRLAHLPLNDIQTQLRANNISAQIDLFARAGIPKPLTLAFRAGVDTIINGTPEVCDTENSEGQIRAVVDEMVKLYEDADRAGIEAILTRLNLKIEAAVHEAARNNKPRVMAKAPVPRVRPRSSPRTNVAKLRPLARTAATPSVVVPAGIRIATGGVR